ncbi:bifunctional phosphopantothenoylcysteine decarboxylase/phosphopantothenate synthase [Bacteroidota bacterium]
MNETLKNRKILVGVTGSIAAYKTPFLVRELVKAGSIVNVIMTPTSKNFVTETVLSNLSGHPVATEMFAENLQISGAWHIQLAHWCDVMIIAPCSATTLSRMAHGLCDTALSTVAIALPKDVPLLISPAMDSTMWEHPATQKNIEILKEYGAVIIPPDDGALASGMEGPGRMPEIQVLIDAIAKAFSNKFGSEKKNEKITDIRIEQNNIQKKSKENTELTVDIELAAMDADKEFLVDIGDFLKGKKILITAGPTYEKVDDVRFIGNYSSGKMGFAIAEEAQRAGAEVTLVTGPVSLETPENIKRISVESASEMYKEVIKEFAGSDIAILSAAVADYTPVEKYSGKIKKIQTGDNLTIKLKSTDDILQTIGTRKKPGQKLIGFALESSNEISNGWKKLKTKNCNMIIVNSAIRPKSGFGGDENTITLLLRNKTHFSFEPMSKKRCAQEILKKVKDV